MSKYRAKKTEFNGQLYASKAEAQRALELDLMEKGGLIYELKTQPRFDFIIDGQKICTYVGDFIYIDRETGRTIVEDVKGVRTPVYKLKKRMFAIWYPDLLLKEIE